MKNISAIFMLTASLLSVPAFAADKYAIDKSHTRILFYVNHLGFSDMIGEFTDYDGYFTFDAEKPQESEIEITLKPKGIRTSSKALDEKLQGADFFKSEQYPEIKFTGGKVNITGKNTGTVNGKVTMLGVTKPTTLNVHFNKADYNKYSGDFIAGFSADASLKRSDFGMNSYIPAVGDEVLVKIQIEGINQTRKEQEKIKH